MQHFHDSRSSGFKFASRRRLASHGVRGHGGRGPPRPGLAAVLTPPADSDGLRGAAASCGPRRTSLTRFAALNDHDDLQDSGILRRLSSSSRRRAVRRRAPPSLAVSRRGPAGRARPGGHGHGRHGGGGTVGPAQLRVTSHWQAIHLGIGTSVVNGEFTRFGCGLGSSWAPTELPVYDKPVNLKSAGVIRVIRPGPGRSHITMYTHVRRVPVNRLQSE
jgi:hypothetical protein